MRAAVATLQQVGLDMLWRLQERATVVRWLLGHGKVIEAITLCQKRRGQWRAGLSPASIPGIDFFNAAVAAVHERESVDVGGPARPYLIVSQDREQSGAIAAEPFTRGPGERVEVMHTVYKFISEWDHSSLTITSSGRSKLATQTQFKFIYTPPTPSSSSPFVPGQPLREGWEDLCCFNELHTAIFNEQFGLIG